MKNVGIAVGGGHAFRVPAAAIFGVLILAGCGAMWIKSKLSQ